MLQLSQDLLAEIYAHGEACFPAECCGLLLGSWEGTVRTATAIHQADNLAAALRNDRYEISAEDRQAADKRADELGLAVIGFYHSHPDHDAYFSPTDLQNSEEYQWGEPWVPPTYAYLVISIHAGRRDHYKAFLVQEGKAVEEPVSPEIPA